MPRPPDRASRRTRLRWSSPRPGRYKFRRMADRRLRHRSATCARSAPAAARSLRPSGPPPGWLRQTAQPHARRRRGQRHSRRHMRGPCGGYTPAGRGRTRPRWPPSGCGSAQSACTSQAFQTAARYICGTGPSAHPPARIRARSAGRRIRPGPRRTSKTGQSTGHQSSSPAETPLAFTIFAMVSRVIRTPPLCLRFHHALIGMSSLI